MHMMEAGLAGANRGGDTDRRGIAADQEADNPAKNSEH